MTISGLDHIALPTTDAERLIKFYKSLGFIIIDELRWRNREVPTFAIKIGESKINVHPPGYEALKGVTTKPGCGDMCFVWQGTTQGVLDVLEKAGVSVVDGPRTRIGARNEGQTMATSVYIRDPDGNLIEFMVYGQQSN